MCPNKNLKNLISLCKEYVEALGKFNGGLRGLDHLRLSSRDCIEEFLLQHEDYSSKWGKDKKLLFMYL